MNSNCKRFFLIAVNLIVLVDVAKGHRRTPRFPSPPPRMKLKERLQERINHIRERNTEHVCYETVGCFDLPHKNSPLQKLPEHPSLLETKFYLFKRDINFSYPEVIFYDDGGTSLRKSKFNFSLPLKVFIHGYVSKWNERGSIRMTDAFLKLYDCNMILLDWEKGARGPQYAIAAANTEVVGRQLGMLLLLMVRNGLKAENIHLIGFSLGAHVAGTSSEVLKREGFKIGRITGLDPASPLFRSNHLKEEHKKLDKSDAEMVDVIHTDGSPTVTDGYGLWEPIGHIDFYANGGQEQPGCTDTQGSIVITSLDKTLTREIACSHIRAFQLFIEALENAQSNGCEFTAFSCLGSLPAYERSTCFPQIYQNNSGDLDESYRNEIGRIGDKVKGSGVMFFNTKDSSPFCGNQLQATIELSTIMKSVAGDFRIKMIINQKQINFYIKGRASNLVAMTTLHGFAVADYKTPAENETIPAQVSYIDFESEQTENGPESTLQLALFFDSIKLQDMYENSWSFCQKNTPLLEKDNYTMEIILKSGIIC